MKKILFQTNDMSVSGGAERVVSIWANYFSDNYSHIDVGILTGAKTKSFYKLSEKVKNEFCNVKPNYRIFPFIRLANIYKTVKSLKAGDAIVINKYNYVHSLYILRKLNLFKNINFVYFAHGGTSDFKKFYRSYRVKKIFYTFDNVVCLHDDQKEEVSYVNRNKIHIIPNPPSFKSNEACDDKSNIVLCVARLSREKGIDLLLKAWSKVKKENWKLQIVGEGPNKEEFFNLCKELNLEDSVEFKGQSQQVKDFYLGSSIYAMTSRYEGMPMVLLEAMECSMPIIAYENQGTTKLLENAGIVVKDFNEDEFVQKLEELMYDSNLRAKYSKLSKEKVKEFDIENIGNKFAKVLGI